MKKQEKGIVLSVKAEVIEYCGMHEFSPYWEVDPDSLEIGRGGGLVDQNFLLSILSERDDGREQLNLRANHAA